MGHYELIGGADVYTQLMFCDYDSAAQIAPGGAFCDISTVNCDNPQMSAQQLATIGCDIAPDRWRRHQRQRRPCTFYLRVATSRAVAARQRFENNSFRGLAGVRGAISENWDYDASAQYSKVKADQTSPTTTSSLTRLLAFDRRCRCGPQRRRPTARARTASRSVARLSMAVTRTAYRTTCSRSAAVDLIDALNYLQVPGSRPARSSRRSTAPRSPAISAASGCRARSHREHPDRVRRGVSASIA